MFRMSSILILGILVCSEVCAQGLVGCPKGYGNWVDGNAVDTCIPCPPIENYLSAELKGLKLPKNCQTQLQGVFITIPSFTQLFAAHTYVLQLKTFKNDLEQQNLKILQNLDLVQSLLDNEKKNQIELSKKYFEIEKQSIELKEDRFYWRTISAIFLTIVLVETVALLIQP